MAEKSKPKKAAPASSDVLDFSGVGVLIKQGLEAAEERRAKNRQIFFLGLALVMSLAWNAVQSYTRPEPKLLGETPDGRIRPLPLLNDPIFTDKEIRVWAERCVAQVYKLSYVDWQTSIRNNTSCLSDKSRADFASSLGKIGVFKYLNPELQGTLYAVPGESVVRKSWLGPEGYNQWIVDVPYRIAVDGRQRGSLEVVMTMRIRRVSLTWREDGIWVDEYQVVPKKAGGA